MKPKPKIAISCKSKDDEWQPKIISEKEKIYRAEVRKLNPQFIFSLLKKLVEGQEIQNKSNSEIQEMMEDI